MARILEALADERRAHRASVAHQDLAGCLARKEHSGNAGHRERIHNSGDEDQRREQREGGAQERGARR